MFTIGLVQQSLLLFGLIHFACEIAKREDKRLHPEAKHMCLMKASAFYHFMVQLTQKHIETHIAFE